MQYQEWELALERVGQVAGANAINAVLASPREREHQWARGLLTGWAATNPSGAAAWLETQPTEIQEQLRANLLTGVARTDAKQALTLAIAQPGGRGYNYMPAIIAASIQHGGFREAEELLNTIDSGPETPTGLKSTIFRALAEAKISMAVRRDDPSVTLTWFDSYVGQDYVGPPVTRDILTTAAKSDVKATLKWLEDRVERLSPLQATTGYGAVAETWIAQSPEQFTAWMNANVDHPQHDAMAETAANLFLRQRDTNQARLWFRTINDPQIRARIGTLLQQGETGSRSQ